MIGKTLLHYRIKEKLDRGGMGEACRFEYIGLPLDVAIDDLYYPFGYGIGSPDTFGPDLKLHLRSQPRRR